MPVTQFGDYWMPAFAGMTTETLRLEALIRTST